MLIVAGTLDLAPEHREELLRHAVPLMEATHAEAGNHEYVFSADPVEPGRVRIFEIWESEEALASHFGEPHMAEFGGKLGDLGVTGNSLTKYTISESGPLR
jgi:quinol monooxygenase YgiN